MPVMFEAVNDTLRRVKVIAGDSNALSTSTNATASEIYVSKSAIQTSVDLVIQLWREGMQELYSRALVPNLLSTATITLVTNTREYSLPSDFERVAGDTYEDRALRAATEQYVIREYKGGYLRMLADQGLASDFTGQPTAWAISPRDGALRLDRDPTSDENGKVYNLPYEKRIDFTVTMATATFPFSDTVTYALVPVVAEAYNMTKKNELNPGMYRASFARAFTMARKLPAENRWGQRRMR